MKARHFITILLPIAALIGSVSNAGADTYSTFQRTRYYSANGQYLVEITPSKRATLYHRSDHLQRLWSRTLPQLPAHLFITNNGSSVVMIDRYYGNGASPRGKVISFLGKHGYRVASYALGEIADLLHVLTTTSSAHWYYGAFFTSNQRTFVLETMVRKCLPPPNVVRSHEEAKEVEDCMEAQPYEELRFSVFTGKLVSRTGIRSKYADREKRLLHELQLAECASPRHDLSLAHTLLQLAGFYSLQKEHLKAAAYYEKAIPIYSKTLGANFVTVAQAVNDAATNYRELGDYHRAEQLYRRALTALDRNQGDPRDVPPIAITVYENYAALLSKLQRDDEAEKMERRAKILRSANPAY
jgi:tetratricopeptide (TPR) repeat protein